MFVFVCVSERVYVCVFVVEVCYCVHAFSYTGPFVIMCIQYVCACFKFSDTIKNSELC